MAATFDDLVVIDRVLSDGEVSLLAEGVGPSGQGADPGAAVQLEGVALSTTEVALAWDPPAPGDDPVAGYRIYRDGQLVAFTGLLRALDRGASPGASYLYEVETVDAAGRVAARSEVTVSMPATGHVLEVLPPGHWYEVPASSLAVDLVGPDEDVPSVMGPWGGGAYDTTRDRLVVWGGGHMDYWGNELYAFDTSSLTWVQLTEPTPKDTIPSPNEDPVYPDGRPASVHTYDGMQYLPDVDRLFASGGSIWSAGNCSGGTWLFDFTAVPPEDGWIDVPEDRAGCGQVSAYDPVTGTVWYTAGSEIAVFDPTDLAMPWRVAYGGHDMKFYQTADIDPQRRLLVFIGNSGAGGQTQAYDISNPEMVTGGPVTTSGDNEIETYDASGFAFDPVQDAFVAWGQAKEDGYAWEEDSNALWRVEPAPTHVYRLDPDTFEWRRVEAARTNVFVPTPPAYSGTFSRWRYMPKYNAYILVNDEEDDVFFYKIGPWAADDTPPPAPAGLGATCDGPGGVRLAWDPVTDPDSGIAYYVVRRDGQSIGTTPVTSYVDADVQAGTMPSYTVSAVNLGGLEGPPSEPVTVEVTEICASGSGGGTSGGTSGGTDGGTGAGTGDGVGQAGSGDGCGCRGPEPRGGGGALVGLGLGLLALSRRRRRHASRRAVVTLVAALSVSLSACGGGPGAGVDTTEGSATGGRPGDEEPPVPEDVPPAPIGEPFATVQVRNEGTEDRTNVTVTFGLPVRRGRVPAGSFLGARVAGGDGAVLATQADVKATHGDGSLRHVILSVRLPDLPAGAVQSLEILRVDAEPAGDPVQLEDVLAADVDAEVRIDLEGTTWTARAAEALGTGLERTWLQGPVVGEWIAMAPLRDGGGAAHPNLVAWFHVRSDAGANRVRVDTVLENTWGYVPPQSFTYDVRVTTCGTTTLEQSGLTHYHRARWRHTASCGGDPQVGVIHDIGYLADTRALANFDRTLTVPEEVIQAVYEAWLDNDGLMEPGLTYPDMPAPAGRPDIGPVPRWNLLYAYTGDPRARTFALGTADRAGAWSVHFRNRQTRKPLTIDEYPYITILGNPSDTNNPETGMSERLPECAGDCSTPLKPDSAHQPALAYVPYLLTGDYYYLEELQFWANYNLIQANPGYREYEAGLVKWEQVRGQAWSLRTLAEAAYITPDDDSLKSFFVERTRNNLVWYNAEYPENPESNPLYILVRISSYEDGRMVSPWQDDFFSWAVGRAWELGFEEALPLIRWKAGFSTLRLIDPGFCWIFASSYQLRVRDAPDQPEYATMAQVYEASVEPELRVLPCGGPEMAAALELQPGEMVGYSSSPEGYPSNLQPAAAIAVDAGAPGAADAWSVFDGRSVKPDYGREPNFAIVPRNDEASMN